MPFIWDDCDWMLVDDEHPYDKNQFVVARKFSVKPNKNPHSALPIEVFSTDQIRREIRKFGEIESCVILEGDVEEAHVTFVSDRSAYLMLLQNEYDKKTNKKYPFEVEPVDSWEQPRENNNQSSGGHDMEVDNPEPREYILNEDCMFHLFKFLDVDSLANMAEVCKWLNRLLHEHHFPRIRKYEIDCENYPIVTLGKVRRALFCIGRHLTDLSFTADQEYNVTYDACNDTRFASKCLKLIAKLVGENIRRAYFRLPLNKDKRIAMIAPILQHLESLEIDDQLGGAHYPYDFTALCPTLIEFKISVNNPLIASCKPWPTLRSLSVMWNRQTSTNTLVKFFELNSQLTCLELNVGTAIAVNNPVILAIKNRLVGLAKLTIYGSCNVPHSILTQLKQLSFLCEIKLWRMDSGNLKGFIEKLSLLTNLRKIQLSCYYYKNMKIDDYKLPLLNLAKCLPNLEELTLSQIPINERILIDLVSSAQQLKALYIRYDGLEVSDGLIDKLVEGLKRRRRHEVLQIYLDQNDLIKLDAARNPTFDRYLQLNLFDF